MLEKDNLVEFLTSSISFGLLYAFLKFAYDNLKDGATREVKAKIGIVISEINVSSLANSLKGIALNLINIIFTEKQFSWKCFKRSFIASGIFVLLLHSIFFFKHPDFFFTRSLLQWLPFITSFIMFFVIYNTFDFLLLWKTRKLLVWLSGKGDKYDKYILLIDIVTSFIFGFVKYSAVMMLINFRWPDLKYFFAEVITLRVPSGFYSGDSNEVIPGLFFYATFLYSIFMVLYLIAIEIAKMAKLADFGKRALEKIIDVRESPFQFINIVVVAVAFLIAVLLFIIQHFTRK